MTKDFIDDLIEETSLKKSNKKLSKDYQLTKGRNLKIAGVEVEKNYKHTDEALRKISEANRGKVVSEETRRKIGEAHKGKIVTEEARKKISEAQIGKVVSEETRRRMSEARRNMSEETRRKFIEALQGQVFSEERRRKMREAHKRRDHNRPIMTPNGEFVSKESLKQRLVADGVQDSTSKIREWFKLYPNDYFYIKR